MQRIGRSILLKSMARCYPLTRSPKPSYLTSMIPFLSPNHPNPRGNHVYDRVKVDVDDLNVQIPQVREKIKYATESKGMRDADDAGGSLELLLLKFDHLPENERSALRQSMGPKIEQLKAEFLQLEVDQINTWFAEAREDIKNQVDWYTAELVSEMFENLLKMLPEKSALRLSMGLKFELLKAEYHQVVVVYFNTEFAGAREKIKAAMESKEMEDAECAREAVSLVVLGTIGNLLEMPLVNECYELLRLKIKRLKAEVVDLNKKFAEAREEIETVKETEDTECARVALNSVLGMFDGLLAKLPENSKLWRFIELKIELLEAEINLLDELL